MQLLLRKWCQWVMILYLKDDSICPPNLDHIKVLHLIHLYRKQILVDSHRRKHILLTKTEASTSLVCSIQEQLSLHLIKSFLFISVLKTTSFLPWAFLSMYRNTKFFSLYKKTRWTNRCIIQQRMVGFRSTFHSTQSSTKSQVSYQNMA